MARDLVSGSYNMLNMGTFKIAVRKLFRKGDHSLTRIFSLAGGLAFGIILLSEVFYYYSYDSFYPDSNRIFIVHEKYNTSGEASEFATHSYVSGAVGPGLKAEVPGIESATRLNSIGEMEYVTEDNNIYKGHFILADEHLHEVFPRQMISGIPQEILRDPLACMVSTEIAEMMGGDVVGKTIEMPNYPGIIITIKGVFEAIPENANYRYDIAISMVSTSHFMWDGTNNWMGNDRYYTCVKLEKGVDTDGLAPAIRQMQIKYQDIEVLSDKYGVELYYILKPIRKVHVDRTKNMIVVLSAIAFIVLFVSVLNYMLLTASTLVNRAKSSAIHKCFGAEKSKLLTMIFADNALIFGISLAVAFGLILALRPFAEVQLGHSLVAAFNPTVIVPIVAILAILVLCVGYFPGHFYAAIPIAAAFRSYRQKSTRWKRALLAVQFTGAALILTMLFVVSLQYEMVKNADHGYSADNVYFGSVSGMDQNKILSVVNEIKALPEVEEAGLGFKIPIFYALGNNVRLPDGDRELFNVADMYYIDHTYFDILGIQVVSGKAFSEEESIPGEVMISQKGADLLALNTGWSDGVVGRYITVTEHNQNFPTSRISGVFPDMVIGTISNPDQRPSLFLYLNRERFIEMLNDYRSVSFYILIKTHQGSHSNIVQKLTDKFNTAMPYGNAEVQSLAAVQVDAYQQQRGFRNAVTSGSIVVLLVTLMGLLGYLNDEITRYRRSLAIRKVNGATAGDVMKIFVKDIVGLTFPCLIAGLAVARLLAGKWLQNFIIQVDLHWWIFLGVGVFVILFTGIVSAWMSLKAARFNPVKALRY